MFLVKNIPRPWQLASGLHMKVCALPYCRLSWYYFKSANSVGRLHVIGKKSYSSGNFFLNYIRLFPKKFFLDNISIPGKWFIFWYGCILANISCLQWPSIQHKSKFIFETGSVDMFHFNFFATNLTTGYWHSESINRGTWDIYSDFLRVLLLLGRFLFSLVIEFGVELV